MTKYKILIFLLLCLTKLSFAQSSYGVFNYSSVEYEHSKNTDEVRSIASITKLFTAKTVLDSGVSLSEEVKVQGKASGRFARGVYVERFELLRAMLMSSDNLAAESLAHAHPGGYEQFISDVATNISDMNLKNTVIVDSTGLLPGNQSSVNDLTDFLFTLRKYPLIQQLSSEKLHTTEYRKGKKTIKVVLKNTNPQMWTYDNIILTKTGFTNPAGRCLAMLVEKGDQLYSVVSLGNKTVVQRSKNITALMNEIGGK
jgi:serine-type D-Ala-D-Ala endopeptidase (penicillin-binding protein 7)